MKKLTTLLLLTAFLAISCSDSNKELKPDECDTSQTTIHVTKAGTLAALLNEDLFSIEKMTIRGKLNGTDLKLILRMFEENKLQSLNLKDASIVAGGEAYLISADYEHHYTADNIIGKWLFSELPNLHEIILPSNIIAIEEKAFSGSKRLKKIEIPRAVKTIPEQAFFDCNALSSVILPPALDSINYEAFSLCRNLKTIDFPASLKYIELKAFEETGLVDVTLPKNVNIASSPFTNCQNLLNVNVHSSNPNLSSEDGILYNKNKTILHAYPGAKTETSYTIKNSVTTIGVGAFSQNKTLTSIIFHENLKEISSCAFYRTAITDVTLPKSLKIIDEKAFYSNYSLKNITFLSNNMKRIDSDAFSYCSKLETITLPQYVEVIGTSIFSSCKNLQKAALPTNIISIPSMTFLYCYKLASIDLHEGITSLDSFAFSSCIALESITIPSTLSTIDSYAFSNCTKLEKIISKSKVAPTCSDGAFNKIDIKNKLMLVVPKGSKSNYQSAEIWREFLSIEEAQI